jgi:hypothetical protein
MKKSSSGRTPARVRRGIIIGKPGMCKTCRVAASFNKAMLSDSMEQKVELLRRTQLIHRVVSLAAVLFGIITIIVGSRVLSGSDPGYNVFLPLILYNIAMGVAYIAAGITMWRNSTQGKYAAVAIFTLNFIVLGTVSYLYAVGASVAVESVAAMTFRTVVWLVLFLGIAWVCRRKTLFGRQHA